MIKLVVSDIDGTLLVDGENELNPELFDVILKLRKQGMQFAAASGRQWVSIERTFDPIKEKIFYLSDNVAYVGLHGRNLYLNTMDPQLARMMVKEIREAGMVAMVSGPDTVYLDGRDVKFCDWLMTGYQFQVKQVEDLMEVEEPFVKVSAYCRSDIDRATKDIREKYKDRLKIAISGDMWMDAPTGLLQFCCGQCQTRGEKSGPFSDRCECERRSVKDLKVVGRIGGRMLEFV